MNPFLVTLLIIFSIQLAFFAFAASFKTDAVTDLAYGLTFVIIAHILLWQFQFFHPLHLALVAVITLWGLRLSGYLFVRILKTKRDKRFDGIREHPLKFAQFWVLQALAIWLILLPAIFALTRPIPYPLSPISILSLLAWSLGFAIQALADYQKSVFKNQKQNQDKLLTTGIYKYSQYPNYFGEMLMWWSIFAAVSTFISGWALITVSGPIFITILLLFVSGIPTVQKQRAKRFGNDKEYIKYTHTTSLLIPLPPKTV